MVGKYVLRGRVAGERDPLDDPRHAAWPRDRTAARRAAVRVDRGRHRRHPRRPDDHRRRRRGSRERGRPDDGRRKVTPEAINFMATHGRGLICLAMTPERLDALEIPLKVRRTRRGAARRSACRSTRKATHVHRHLGRRSRGDDPCRRSTRRRARRPGAARTRVSAARARRRRAGARRSHRGGRRSGAHRRAWRRPASSARS